MLPFYRYSPFKNDELINHKNLEDEPIVFKADDIKSTFKIGFQTKDGREDYTLEVNETPFDDLE